MISMNSSRVPKPPGRARKASDSSAMTAVRQLLVEQGFRNDSDDISSGVQHRIGNRAHEADRPAAVDQAYPFFGNQLPDRDRRLPVDVVSAWLGAAKDADSLEHGNILPGGCRLLRPERLQRALDPLRL